MATERDQARILLRKAANDEALVRKVCGDADIADELIGFHAQQAVEKSMKAVLAAHGVRFPFVHDLGVLRDLCKEAGVPLGEDVGDVAELTPYAGGLRYDEDTLELVDRETAVRLATAAVEWARTTIERADSH